jgi:HSP20 family protein
MTQLVKRNKGILPSFTNDFFNTERLFNPSILDFDGGLLDLGNSFPIPDANISENDKDYTIELAAPGLEKKDFIVEVQDGVLNISAEKEEEKTEEDKNYKRREFSYDSFSRSFTLPENCVPDKIDAKYENGVLHLSLPKKEVTISKPAKQIKVA